MSDRRLTGSLPEAGSALGHDELVAIHDVAARFYQERLQGSWVPGYRAGRGFEVGVQRQWRVGYAPAERDALTVRLRAAGYADNVIVAAGLARRTSWAGPTDTFRNRAVLPILSADGVIVAFIGRAAESAGSGRA